jgi:transcriptional/translational regulatory protein YebC/TACO1
MVKEIFLARKGVEQDSANNARRRAALEPARKASVPREHIERAIQRSALVFSIR